MPRTPAGTLPAEPEATPAQMQYLINLIQERDTTGIELGDYVKAVTTKAAASTLITKLRSQPRKAKGLQPTEDHVGLWTYQGGAYRVHLGNSGHFYTTRMTREGWELAPGVTSSVIQGGTRMTDEEILAFGVQFVHCILCGRELTNPVSQALGMGPDCAQK